MMFQHDPAISPTISNAYGMRRSGNDSGSAAGRHRAAEAPGTDAAPAGSWGSETHGDVGTAGPTEASETINRLGVPR